MKIFQFIPNPLNKAPERTGTETRLNSGQAAGSPKTDFAAFLRAASVQPPPPAPEGPNGAVSQENLRALRLPPANELGLAGRLLSRLNSDIRAATPEDLRNIHDLEGLIYVHSKTGV